MTQKRLRYFLENEGNLLNANYIADGLRDRSGKPGEGGCVRALVPDLQQIARTADN